MKVRKHLITIRFLEEEVSRYKKQVEQLENDLVDTKKMLELSVDESVRGEIIRICTENESLKTQLDFVRLQLASRSPRSLGSNKPPSFDEEVEAEKISSTPINGQRLNTPLNHSGTCRELFSGSDVSCQV